MPRPPILRLLARAVDLGVELVLEVARFGRPVSASLTPDAAVSRCSAGMTSRRSRAYGARADDHEPDACYGDRDGVEGFGVSSRRNPRHRDHLDSGHPRGDDKAEGLQIPIPSEAAGTEDGKCGAREDDRAKHRDNDIGRLPLDEFVDAIGSHSGEVHRRDGAAASPPPTRGKAGAERQIATARPSDVPTIATINETIVKTGSMWIGASTS